MTKFRKCIALFALLQRLERDFHHGPMWFLFSNCSEKLHWDFSPLKEAALANFEKLRLMLVSKQPQRFFPETKSINKPENCWKLMKMQLEFFNVRVAKSRFQHRVHLNVYWMSQEFSYQLIFIFYSYILEGIGSFIKRWCDYEHFLQICNWTLQFIIDEGFF